MPTRRPTLTRILITWLVCITLLVLAMQLFQGCTTSPVRIEHPAAQVEITDERVNLELEADVVLEQSLPDLGTFELAPRMFATMIARDAYIVRFPLRLLLSIELDDAALCGELTFRGVLIEALPPCMEDPP